MDSTAIQICLVCVFILVLTIVICIKAINKEYKRPFDKDNYTIRLLPNGIKRLFWFFVILLLAIFAITFSFNDGGFEGFRYFILIILVLFVPVIICIDRYKIVVIGDVINYTPKIGKKIVLKFSDITKVIVRDVVRRTRYSRYTIMEYDVYSGDEKVLWISENVINYRLFVDSLSKYGIDITDEQGNTRY